MDNTKVEMSDPIMIHSKMIYHPIDDYQCLQILESGWIGYYHTIVENGDMLSTIHKVMTKDQILNTYGIEVDFDKAPNDKQ